jgi:transcriptional regulator with PAS, ATPase and Fis domain
MIDKIAHTDANILITGESGTGKEVIAREIHKRSNRKDDLFVTVDLGSIHENLFESELFGHSKGAFTDAVSNKAGRIELASGGTLFLDEISNLSMTLQMKLLTVIQNKSVVRLGENNPRTVDFRLISATNKSLDKMISEKLFREDLLYRLKTVELKLPPLRKRIEDIPTLSRFYLEKYSTKYEKNVVKLSEPALNRFLQYHWPGNIRELQHVIEKAVILSEGNQLKLSDFTLTPSVKIKSEKSKTFNLEENEKEVIENALKTFNWNMSKTAKELGINRSTLYEKLKKYEL